MRPRRQSTIAAMHRCLSREAEFPSETRYTKLAPELAPDSAGLKKKQGYDWRGNSQENQTKPHAATLEVIEKTAARALANRREGVEITLLIGPMARLSCCSAY